MTVPAQALAQRSLQDLVAILGCPNDMIAMIIFGMTGCTIAHMDPPDLETSRQRGPQGQEGPYSFAEADRLKAGGLYPFNGKSKRTTQVGLIKVNTVSVHAFSS